MLFQKLGGNAVLYETLFYNKITNNIIKIKSKYSNEIMVTDEKKTQEEYNL